MITSKEYFKKIILLNTDEAYQQNFNYFVKLLKRTRIPFLKRNHIFMGAIQIGMLKGLSTLQQKYRIAKDNFANPNNNGSNKKEAERKMFILQEWIRVLQTIADGIAWRALIFNRPLIRAFSENNSPGHLEQSNYDYVNVLIKWLGKMRYFTIVNDLTRCLRVADLTSIEPKNRPVLYEIKKSGNKMKDLGFIIDEISKHKRALSKQELRQWVVQFAAVDNKIIIPHFKDGKVAEEIKAEIIDLDYNFGTHINEVGKMIKAADRCKYHYVQKELEDGYFAQVISYDKMGNNFDIEGYKKYCDKEIGNNSPLWFRNKKSNIIRVSNFESFMQDDGQYPRNFLPYSVLPLPAQDCVRLMMGGIHIKFILNLDTLKYRFREHGWEVTDVNNRHTKESGELLRREYREGSFYKFRLDERIYWISKKHDGGSYLSVVLLTQIIMMLTSMYKMDFLINGAETLFNLGLKCNFKNKKIMLTMNYIGERKVLI